MNVKQQLGELQQLARNADLHHKIKYDFALRQSQLFQTSVSSFRLVFRDPKPTPKKGVSELYRLLIAVEGGKIDRFVLNFCSEFSIANQYYSSV
jgi:hypothetical protein